ncbi:hypothetical protein [Arthrobacter sp. PAMC 25486]|uniref:hypothetical protein n=1 Tax=Arthrobacter sp. PAMC 25486 TaxID=1494608 RepID=UPI0012FEFDB8|nr:hypothetical protein [Arthrobacter sp. PAMC 25486]
MSEIWTCRIDFYGGNKLRRILGVLTVAAVLAFGFGSVPAQAFEAVPQDTSGSNEFQVTDYQSQQVDLVLKSVSNVDGVDQFDYTEAVAAGVDAEFATEFAAGFIAGGGVPFNAPAGVEVAGAELAEVAGTVAAAAAACQGRTGSNFYWWGHQIRMDSCLTNVVINAMWGGVGVAGLVGIFASPTGIGAAAAVVAAAMFTIGAAGLGICASWGSGIYINQLYVGPPICWAQ